jgi:hypothetical protein
VTTIHDELARASGQNPAGYIATTCFARLTLQRLLAAAKLMTGKYVRTDVKGLTARFHAMTWATPPSALLMLPVKSKFPDLEVDVLITSNFEVDFDIVLSGAPSNVISEVKMSISNARVHVRAENNSLIIEGADFSSVRTISRKAADDVLNAAKIDLKDAAHIEGHIGYGVASQAVADTLGQRYEIPLSTVFPSVDFGSKIKLKILSGGMALGIIPTETVRIVSSAHCPCKDGPELDWTNTDVTATNPPEVVPNTVFGRVKVGGPVADKKDPLTAFGPRPAKLDGMIGLYVPRDFAHDLTVEVMPSIKITASDNGTIGFKAEGDVGFKNLRVSFDQIGGGILLDIDLDISVTAECDFNLFRGLRIPIAWGLVQPAPNSKATVQLGFYPSVTNFRSVQLKSTLRRADMGSYVATLLGVGDALDIFGVPAILGFLIDAVLSAVVSSQLPGQLSKEISSYLGSHEWKLIDGAIVSDPTLKASSAAPFDVTPTSLLASFDMTRG